MKIAAAEIGYADTQLDATISYRDKVDDVPGLQKKPAWLQSYEQQEKGPSDHKEATRLARVKYRTVWRAICAFYRGDRDFARAGVKINTRDS